MRVLVCGGRSYSDAHRVKAELASCGATLVIHGGASGADALAGEWARLSCVPYMVFPAKWSEHGRKAGPIRNRLMLEQSYPELVLAFPGGAGTADMVRRARSAGVPVKEVK